MVTALIFAGGTGSRMNSKTRPKQFLELHGKPIIIHTINWFENHNEIDRIIVVCIENWIDTLKEYLKINGINKVEYIVPGGKTGIESIHNGLKKIYETSSNPDEEIVLIHDGVRPLITDELISQNIKSVREFGSAITVSPAKETMIIMEGENKTITNIPDRTLCGTAKAPQSFVLSNIYNAYEQAMADELENIVDSASLMLHYGHKLNTVKCSADNIKITTPSDYYIFRALYEARENSQIWGF